MDIYTTIAACSVERGPQRRYLGQQRARIITHFGPDLVPNNAPATCRNAPAIAAPETAEIVPQTIPEITHSMALLRAPTCPLAH
jgi:hypothetical protein